MAVQVDYPGVYIDEVTPGAPIEGVGTSTAAFLGTWKFGDPNKPIKLFSWDDFLRKFGDPLNPGEPLLPADNDYLYYAVRGFFQNGGKVCYVARISNAKADSVVLNDSDPTSPKRAMRLVGLEAKPNTPQITIKVGHVNAVNTTLFQVDGAKLASEASKNNTVIEINDPDLAIQFRPTDQILIGTELAEVVRVEIKEENGADKAYVKLASAIQNTTPFPIDTAVRLADLTKNSTVLRIKDDPHATLEIGSVIEISGVTKTVKSISLEVISPVLKTWRVTLQEALNIDISSTNAVTLTSLDFSLWVKNSSGSFPATATYQNLSMNPSHPRYFREIINNDPNRLINAESPEIPNTTAIPLNRPSEQSDISLTGGQLENRNTIRQNNYEEILAELALIDDINIVCAPGVTDQGIQQALVAHCDTLTKDRFAILDSRRDPRIADSGSVAEQMASVQGSNGGYAALYYPWIQVASSSVENHRVLVPPSGHIAGVYARTDNNRGVHKAPAGTEANLIGALGVERTLSDTEQGDLNKTYGINVIRVFQPGGLPIIWGARTTATQRNKNWQYVNVRRLFLFLEESIQEGIRWAVFEPNNQSLWGKLNRTITAFLTQQWRDGALFGATAKDAFFVRIDDALNPPDQQKLGRLTIEIGVRPVYPAEFIVVRIGIWDGGTTVL